MLNLPQGAGPYVKDLDRNSVAVQSINQDFPRYCRDLQLFSIFETEKTNLYRGNDFVVERDIAILDHENEKTAYLTADHRRVCKFATKKDPNYNIVRNALAEIIDSFRGHEIPSQMEFDNEEQKLLDAFLGTTATPEDDYMDVDHLRVSGSCEWIMKKSKYREWQESANTRFYWISAKPATGKTFLSGKIVHHLKDLNRDCQFYFFDHGDKVKSSITAFLLSMARQMAHLHPEVLHAVLELRKKEGYLKKSDYRTIWRVLYTECILHTRLARPQFWVIDALDECQAGSELIPLLLRVMNELPVRIFLTSRDPYETYRQSIPRDITILSDQILKDDTQFDLELYLQRRIDDLHLGKNEWERRPIQSEILKKADGCFLWVKLVLDQLSQVQTLAEIHQVLSDVPTDMDALYSRVLENMSRDRNPRRINLTKAILTWTVCAAQALTAEELKAAIQLDIGDEVLDIENSITILCGQLVYVDQHQKRVHVVHQTVREYLFRAKGSEFAIDKQIAHRELAMTCLKYLRSPEMAGPTNRRVSFQADNSTMQQLSQFAPYACNSFFEHLNHISSTSMHMGPAYDELVDALAEFLGSTNVLSWIEYIARHSDLKRLILTGQAIKHFLQKSSKGQYPYSIQSMLEHPCSGKAIQSNLQTKVASIDPWATDLIRLVTKFGKNLLASPLSIHHLIPPFCPPESALRKLFMASSSSRGISLVGLKDPTWGDCLSTIIDRGEVFVALACSEAQFAIGTASGTIKVYNPTTCQEIKSLYKCHGEPIKHLKYGEWKGILVSSGSRMIRVWDAKKWTQLYEFSIPAECLALSIADDEEFLLGALQNNQIIMWELSHGHELDFINWTEDLEGQRADSFRVPIAAAFSEDECFLAAVYQDQDILLWDIKARYLFPMRPTGAGGRPPANGSVHGGVLSLVFGTGITGTLLAAAYAGGDLIIFDTTTESEVVRKSQVKARILTASPDGRTLAAGDSSGTIRLYDFETMKLLYWLKLDECNIRKMKFSADSRSLLDIRGSQCQVWDPMALVRQDTEEDLSDAMSISDGIQEPKSESFDHDPLVTSLACCGSSEIFFCGKQDGAVYQYDMVHEREVRKLFSHDDEVAITRLCFDDKSQRLGSVDSSGRIMIHEVLFREESGDWEVGRPIFDEVGKEVDQILFNEGNTRVLVSSAVTGDTLWEISPKGNKIVGSNSAHPTKSCRWATHPLNPDQLILIVDRVVHLYEWKTLKRLTRPEGILLEADIPQGHAIRSIIPCLKGSVIATTFGQFSQRHCKSKLLLWNAADFSLEFQNVTIKAKYKTEADEIDFLIGMDRRRLVFLHSDNWICSKDPLNPEGTARHFFLPADWLTINNDLMIEIAQPGREILFVKRSEVAVIKRGLVSDELGLDAPHLRRLSPFGKRNSYGSMPAVEGRDIYRIRRSSTEKKSPFVIEDITFSFEEKVQPDNRFNVSMKRSSMTSNRSSIPTDFSPLM